MVVKTITGKKVQITEVELVPKLCLGTTVLNSSTEPLQSPLAFRPLLQYIFPANSHIQDNEIPLSTV